MFSVAQIANLPYRRLQIGRALAVFRRPGQGAVLQDGILRHRRLAVCATNTAEALNRDPSGGMGEGSVWMRKPARLEIIALSYNSGDLRSGP